MRKLVAEDFLRSASSAAFLAGLTFIPGAFIGNIAGGLLMRMLKLKARSFDVHMIRVLECFR